MEHNYPNLLSPLTIGNTIIKNRIVFPAIVTNYAKTNGDVSLRMINYYTERARGGAGLIITEGAYPHISGKRFPRMLGAEERNEESLKELTDTVHKAGGKIALQLLHAGRRAIYQYCGCQPLGPTALPAPKGEIPKEMTAEDIEYITNAYVDAIARAKRVGFDGVEVHIAHGYLLNQFASALINTRTDEFGGSTENRTRISCNIINRAREIVGNNFLILCKLNGNDYTMGGITPQESSKIASLLEKAGADAITVSGGLSYSAEMVIQPAAIKAACHLESAEIVAEAVKIPVGLVGRIQRPKLAEEILSDGKIDFICMGRALLADPFLPQKITKAEENQICPCIVCMKGCCERESTGLAITCAVNPRVGREKDFCIEASQEPKKVVVIGGGYAGMEAAKTAAECGHIVSLYEKGGRLGGQGYLASLPPHKEEINLLNQYLQNELERLGVKVNLNSEVIADNIPDVDCVILATGSLTGFPKITIEDVPGKITAALLDSLDVLEEDIEGKKAVIIGGGLVGCETAEKLAKDNEVIIVEMLPNLAGDMEAKGKKVLLNELESDGVTFFTSTKFLKIKGDSVWVECSGVVEKITEVDTVIWATGRKSVNNLADAVKSKGIDCTVIGDALAPRHILAAIHDGFNAALDI